MRVQTQWKKSQLSLLPFRGHFEAFYSPQLIETSEWLPFASSPLPHLLGAEMVQLPWSRDAGKIRVLYEKDNHPLEVTPLHKDVSLHPVVELIRACKADGRDNISGW